MISTRRNDQLLLAEDDSVPSNACKMTETAFENYELYASETADTRNAKCHCIHDFAQIYRRNAACTLALHTTCRNRLRHFAFDNSTCRITGPSFLWLPLDASPDTGGMADVQQCLELQFWYRRRPTLSRTSSHCPLYNQQIMRFFNTEGPVVSEDNYFIPPLDRVERGALFRLIERNRYFVLHAPRQTGKTSTLLALRDELNAAGRCRAVYANIEIAQSARENVAEGIAAVVDGAFSRQLL